MTILSTAGIEQDLATIGSALRQITVLVRARGARGGHGSGIVWHADGTIVTNAHVATTGRLAVELQDGRAADARLVTRDPGRDLAILRVDPVALGDPLAVATVGEPSALRPGELVVALGHPLGVPHAMALGVVHAIGGTPSVVRSDIRLAPGNSGGPLADTRGRVLGVNAMIAGGLGVAVSIDEVRRLLHPGTPRLGATLRPVTVRLPGNPDTLAAGLLVLAAAAGGPADRAGILPGDVLLGHAGRPFHAASDLLALLHDAGPGATLRLDVGRAGRRISVTVELGTARAGRRAA